jgi:hypothetical protein
MRVVWIYEFPSTSVNVSYEAMRRSSRIPKELVIVLTGSDMEGKGFSEMTKTVLLSRHGAGIKSTFKLYPEQEIIIRYLDTNKEAFVRVVGQIGDEGETHTYGVAFLDPNIVDFWGIDFAPVTDKDKEARRVVLECATCGRCESVQQTEVESDVFLVNGGIVRHCKSCRDSTLWKRSNATPEQEPALLAVSREARTSSFAGLAVEEFPAGTEATGSSATDSRAPSSNATAPSVVNAAASITSVAVDEPPAASSAAGTVAEEESEPAPPARVDPPTTQINKRKHTRMKVSYKACVRSGVNDDVVSCENMSRGGICFKSRKKYFEGMEIKVAVPYAPGGNAIFVPATIAWVIEVEKEKQYKCGVTYRITTRVQ